MDRVGTRPSDDINRSARTSPGFCGQPIVHNLELTYQFQRKLGPCCSGELVVVFYAIDVERVAARTLSSEGKAAVIKRGRLRDPGLLIGTGQSGSEQYEIKIVASNDRRFLDPFLIDASADPCLAKLKADVAGCDYVHLLRDTFWFESNRKRSLMPKLKVNGADLSGRKSRRRHSHFVSTRRQLRDQSVTVCCGNDCASLTRRGVGDRDGRTRNHRSRVINRLDNK